MGRGDLCRHHPRRHPCRAPKHVHPRPARRDAGVVPKHQITLGLDLQGGSHLVLEVDSAALRHDRLQSLVGDARAALRKDGVRTGYPSAFGRRCSHRSAVADPAHARQGDRCPQIACRRRSPPIGFSAGASDLAFDGSDASQPIKVTLTEAGLSERMTAAVDQSLEIIRRRVDQVGVAEPLIQRVGSDRILVQLPGLQDPTRLRQLLGSTAQMSFHMVDTSVDPNTARRRAASTSCRAPMTAPNTRSKDRVAISGERLADAKAGFNQQTNEPIVSFTFDSRGARQFAEITRDNVGLPFRHRARRQGPDRAGASANRSRAARARSAATSPPRKPPFCRRCCAPAPCRRR